MLRIADRLSGRMKLVVLAVVLLGALVVIQMFSGPEGLDPRMTVLPSSRSFYLGMTPWPYDFTSEAVDKTYQTVGAHSDLIAHHLDEGVPWPEALTGAPYPPKVIAALDLRVSRIQRRQKKYLAVTPLSRFRDGLAPYWTEEGKPLPGTWTATSFSDPQVIQAYTNFCRYLIQRFQPDFMAYGIEANQLAVKNPAAFPAYLILAEQVYKTLKVENPSLPIFVTIQLEEFRKDRAAQTEIVKKLLPFSDYVAVSTYPFFEVEDPSSLPRDYFSGVRELAPTKPLAVAETGYVAEQLALTSYGLTRNGTPDWQAAYLRLLFEEGNRQRMPFIVWFVSRDYDAGWKTLEQLGMDEILKTWRDTGLQDGQGNARASLSVWDQWLKLARR